MQRKALLTEHLVMLLVVEDLSATVGKENEGKENIIGKHTDVKT